MTIAMKRETVLVAGREIIFETGRVARLADAAVLVRQGDTMVLVTAQAAPEPRKGIGFLPLTVEYRERTAAAGRIPGGFLKREGRPGDHEILAARILDRTIRPLFPKGYRHEVQVIATILSAEPEVDPDVLALAGAGLALSISSIPWNGPATGLRVARGSQGWIANPTRAERAASAVDLVVAMAPEGLAMVEGELGEVPEPDVLDALEFGAQAAEPLMDLARRWREERGRRKIEPALVEPDPRAAALVEELGTEDIAAAIRIPEKLERHTRFDQAVARIQASADPEEGPPAEQIQEAARKLRNRLVRERIAGEGIRIDGRAPDTVRPITIETGWLPRAHGSALFTRGETQAMVTCTLAGPREKMFREYLWGKEESRFFLHYNFPPYSVGEVRPIRGTGRREIGHGNLAQRALAGVLPEEAGFPYTLRVVSDISESNGSSSMATVCGGCLAMMDAGVPLASPVAGVAMGLIQEGESTVVLTDILGDEDHLGDMDFKVCGTRRGITALQMDNKLGSLPREVMGRALERAAQARRTILDEMERALPQARPEPPDQAPRIETIWIRPERIREVIGPGGKVIQGIQKAQGSQIEIHDSGRLTILAPGRESLRATVEAVQEIVREPEVGKVYRGKVMAVRDFGAVVSILGRTEGTVRREEWEEKSSDRIPSSVRPGDVLLVRVLGADDQGRIQLSRRRAMGVQPEEIVE